MGLVALRGGRAELAQPMFRQAARLAPGDPAPHRGLAAIAQMRGDPRRAVGEWRKVVRRAPTSPRDRAGLALAYEASGQPDRALRVWREVLGLSPDPDTVEMAEQALERLMPPAGR